LFLLPWIALLLGFLLLAGLVDRDGSHRFSLHAAFLASVVLWGATLVAITEALSLGSLIERGWLAVAWGMAIAGAAIFGGRRQRIARGWLRFRAAWKGLASWEWGILAAVALLAIVLLLVAWFSPANNVDSQIYHMGRVVHWAQNHSLRAYAATNFGQNTKPLWAEAAILNLRVLWGSDRPANLVQWFSMLTSLAAVSGLAQLLGADRRGQVLAVAFAFSIPLGILEATSTQNDYAVAMWVACLVYFVVRLKKNPSSVVDLTLVGLSLGLGLLTKGTFYAYAFPILVWFFLPRLAHVGVLHTIRDGLLVAALAVLLNLGYWGRNFASYGGPFGSPGGLPLVVNELFSPGVSTAPPGTVAPSTPSPETSAAQVPTPLPDSLPPLAALNPVESLGSRLAWFLQRLAQNFGQNSVMPFHFLTTVTWNTMLRLPGLFDPAYVHSLAEGMWNHEDTAGSPMHLLLGLAATIVLVILAIRRRELRLAAWLSLVTFAGYAMLGLISYSVDLFGIRYQLPFFVLSAPLVGLAATLYGRRAWPIALLTAVVIAMAVPYVLLNNMRPVIGWRPKTRSASVFTAPPLETLYTLVPEWQDEHAAVADQVLESSCRAVGLQLSPTPFDYPWWWLLQAPQSGVRIRNLGVAPPPRGPDAESGIQPCAIICTRCAGAQAVGGLPLVADYGHVQLFSGSP
jgi:hypothetical protein